mgnify:CR=1 FL=1
MISHFLLATDDELALVKAIEDNFKNSALVFCTRHIQKNIKMHLEKYGTEAKVRKQIEKAIFDEKSGLLSVNPGIDFDLKKIEFTNKYGDYFKGNYLENLMKRLEKNVLEPSMCAKCVGINWKNNDSEVLFNFTSHIWLEEFYHLNFYQWEFWANF